MDRLSIGYRHQFGKLVILVPWQLEKNKAQGSAGNAEQLGSGLIRTRSGVYGAGIGC